jgi:cytochrome P450
MVDSVSCGGDVADLARSFNHWDPAMGPDPYPLFRQLRDRCPVARSDEHGGFFVVSHYDGVNEALRDHSRFSSKVMAIPAPEEVPLPFPPLDQDPPDHTRYRQLLLPFFTAGRAAKLEPVARATARRLAADVRDGCEAYGEYCFPMPTVVLAEILGVDASDQDRFLHWIEMVVDQAGIDREGNMDASLELFEYLSALLEERRRSPRDDLLTFLHAAEVDGEPLTDPERLGIAFLLLIAGIDTTANTLANALWYLAQDPDARARLAGDQSLMPSAVEEFLRIYAPVSLTRTTRTDVELSGCPIASGAPLFLSLPSANRDERQFPNAEEVILDRENNAHIAFGTGVHRCLGAHVARMEMRVGLEELLAAVSQFALADPDAVEWKAGPIRGPKRFQLVIS